MRRFVAVLAVAALVLAACGDSDDGDPVAVDEAPTTTSAAPAATAAPTTTAEAAPVTELGSKPTVVVPEGDPPTSLVIDDLVVGDGTEVTAGALVEVHYVGVTFADGEQFDASWDRGQTFNTAIPGQVIAGWNEGILGMRVGGRRQLVIPPEQAYGPAGGGHQLAGQTLVFVVDLVNAFVGEGPDAQPDVEVPAEAATELAVEVLTPGDGAVVAPGDDIIVNYVGVAQSTGEVFDSSWSRSTPINFPIGVGRVIPGWDEGLVGQNVGSRVRLVIPPDQAYGEAGTGPIGPNETLVFVVDILGVLGG